MPVGRRQQYILADSDDYPLCTTTRQALSLGERNNLIIETRNHLPSGSYLFNYLLAHPRGGERTALPWQHGSLRVAVDGAGQGQDLGKISKDPFGPVCSGIHAAPLNPGTIRSVVL